MSKIAAIKKQLELPNLYETLNDRQALGSVTSSTGLGVYASSDRLFKGAIFGRDSLEVAEDLMLVRPKLVAEILKTMVVLQGEHYDEANEEEFGKIVHEYRSTVVDDKPLDEVSNNIFKGLSQRWGGNDHQLAYYGSVDSTPLFIRTLGTYVSIYGPGILRTKIVTKTGRPTSLKEGLIAANDWLKAKLRSSRSGLLEYRRLNPHGIYNQVWKDSSEFYMHGNGEPANHDQPIASIEVQALAYDALQVAKNLLKANDSEQLAERLRQATLGKLWFTGGEYFALGLDHHGNQEAILDVLTANPAEMLDSTFFDNLASEDRQHYVSSIAKKIMGEDFLSDAGIRSRALSEAKLVDHWDYHGSFTTWPKETYDIAKGLRRQGFGTLAVELENRILNSIRAASHYPEFFYVDRFGRVLGTAPHSSTHGEIIFVDSTNRPEKVQAWTVSAVLAIKYSRKRASRKSQEPWQSTLEKQILRSIPHVPLLKTKKELRARYPFYPYELRKGDK